MVVRCCNPSTLEVEAGEPRELKAGLERSTLVKNRGLGFQCQHPHGGLQPTVTLAPRDLVPCSSLLRHCMHVII